jgi:hypothetical protein
MTTQQKLEAIKNGLKELEGASVNEVVGNNALLAVFKSIYTIAYGEQDNNCLGCGSGEKYVQFMKMYESGELEAMLSRKFSLKPHVGVIAWLHSNFTNATLTDEVAKEMIAQVPGVVDMFETVDQEWLDAFNAASPAESVSTETTGQIKVTMPNGNKRTRSIAVGDPVLIGEEKAPDGDYELKGVTFKAKDGLVSELF